MNKYSITSNSIKTYKHLDRLQLLQKGVASPVLLVVSPTNVCNMRCSACCFDDRDKNLELNFDSLKESVKQFKALGIKAVELSGGGQPTLYSKINELIDFVHDDLKLDLGMNTNTISLAPIQNQVYKFKWIRLSFNFLDEEKFRQPEFINKIEKQILPMQSQTNITACYIVSQIIKTKYLKKVIEFAERNKIFTRIAPDCIQSKDDIRKLIEEIKPFVKNSEYCFVSDFNVYLEERIDNFCAMHFLKPLLFTDNQIYVCPSAELSLENVKNVSEKFRICKGDEAYKYYTENFETFNHTCNYCKYAKQNEILHDVLTKTDFNNFV
jgi:MoaA/NifB/PqqE/SkfB family radical SAM enzyme